MSDEITKALEAVNAERNKLIHDLNLDFDRKLEGKISQAALDEHKSKVMSRLDALEKDLVEVKKVPAPQPKDEKQADQFKAFDKFLRKGLGALEPEERKVLTIADSTHAGVLAPYEYVMDIIKSLTTYHPLRGLATVRNTDKYAVEFPTETAVPAATWVAESGQKTETTGLTYGLTEVKTFEMKMLFKATQKMLEDGAFNLEAELGTVYARKFGALEGTAFYSGNGTTAPEGIIANATVLADAKDVTTNDTLAFDDLIKAQYALASPYAKNAAWLMNRALMGTLVGLKNATTNAFILQPDAQAGFPPRILGSPVYEWSDFPAIDSTALGTTPGDAGIVCAYGDFKAGYVIVDRLELQVQRLIEMYADYGMIGFLARRRVGGGVVLPEAIQLLKNQTS